MSECSKGDEVCKCRGLQEPGGHPSGPHYMSAEWDEGLPMTEIRLRYHPSQDWIAIPDDSGKITTHAAAEFVASEMLGAEDARMAKAWADSILYGAKAEPRAVIDKRWSEEPESPRGLLS